MTRRGLFVIVALGVSLLAGLTISPAASAAEVISIGTLAPRKSPMGHVLHAWTKAIKKKSRGQLKVKVYYNAAQGDENAMVAKMRSAQLDGAFLTSPGLASVYNPMGALEMPGLFQNWTSMHKARKAMSKEFKAGATKAGFIIGGWGDVGLARTMSKGKAIRTGTDLKTMKVYRWKDDPIGPVMASVIGYPSVPSSVPGLLPALSSGRINVATLSSYEALVYQWWTHLDHVTDLVVSIRVGAIVFAKPRVDALSSRHRSLLLKTGNKAAKMLSKRLRREDEKAYKMLKKRMTVVQLSSKERNAWHRSFKQVRDKLGQGVFAKSLVAKLKKLTKH